MLRGAYLTTSQDPVVLYYPGDDAFEAPTDDELGRYVRTGDASVLRRRGDPTEFHCRPLTPQQYDDFFAHSRDRGPTVAALVAFGYGCRAIKGWVKSDGTVFDPPSEQWRGLVSTDVRVVIGNLIACISRQTEGDALPPR